MLKNFLYVISINHKNLGSLICKVILTGYYDYNLLIDSILTYWS